ncbi:hypothetical protein R3P38DRAFT_2858969 [Favolaschia claudopus]|uniref:F-box domain-containing protein n=1 Tax=Favolaschia claudopus TaxID=2862362 RepID=A0AAW0DK80_9AGAR
MSVSLAEFPEELLERILALAVIAPCTPHPRAPWHPHTSSGRKETRGRIAPLLVSSVFHRIALPLFYHTLVIHSATQSASLFNALRAKPYLAKATRVLVLPSPSACDAQVLAMLSNLSVLDVSLPHNATVAEDVEPLADGMRKLTGLHSLSVRKPSGTYLSQPAPRLMLEALADTVSSCANLHTTTLSFPLSSDPSMAALTSSLSAAPSLTTLRTPLPSLPTSAPAYVEVAQNPVLQRVCLGRDDTPANPFTVAECDDEETGCAKPTQSPPPTRRRDTFPSSYQRTARARPLPATALFFSAARKHSRLAELIRAGTDIASVGGWRGRSATVVG